MVWGIVFLFSLSGFAQTAQQDIMEANKVFLTHKVKFDLRYELFPSYNNSKPMESIVGNLKMWEDQYWLRLGQIESVVNSKYMLYLDRDQKVIVIGKYSKNKLMSERQKSILPMLDSLLKKFIKAELHAQEKENKTWRIYFKKNIQQQYAYADLQITKGYITKVTLYYAKPLKGLVSHLRQEDAQNKDLPRLEITYENYSLLKKADDFAIDRFVIIKNKEVQLTESYKKFKLINNMN